MNCVGIDVSKGKSMIAVMRLFGEVVVSPFEVRHTTSEPSELAKLLKSLDEMCIRDSMESDGVKTRTLVISLARIRTKPAAMKPELA